MNANRIPVETEMVACEICRKEVPLSGAQAPEAMDYVAHFCGLECYEQWKNQAEAEGDKAEE